MHTTCFVGDFLTRELQNKVGAAYVSFIPEICQSQIKIKALR